MAALDLLENPSCMHFGISKCWSEWIENNKYSNQETKGRLNNGPPFKSIFNSNERIRNPALKSWPSKLTGLPSLRFLHAYFCKFGFVEGTAGFIYCANIAYSEFLIQIKIREIKNQVTMKTILKDPENLADGFEQEVSQ